MKKTKKGKRFKQFDVPISLSTPFVTIQTIAGTVNGGTTRRFGVTGAPFLIVSITALKNPNSGDAEITFSVIIDPTSAATQYTATVHCPQGVSVAVPAIFAMPSLVGGPYHDLEVVEPSGTCSGTFTVALLQFGG